MTDQHSLLKDIWKDPVWSKVISVIIIGIFIYIADLIAPNFGDSVKDFLLHTNTTPNWVYIAILVAVIAWTWLSTIFNRKKTAGEHLTSGDWFDEIVRQIADCKSARIYLRGFSHPDQFRSDHRDALLKFMQLLKIRFETGADIEIVAYHYSKDVKSGLDWLKSELGADFDALSRITLIQNQPVSNSSSLYLFDNGVMLYNERKNTSASYYSQNLSGTVVHHLLEKGYVAVRSTCK